MMPPVKEPLAGLALLVIFGVLIWYNRPIESSPPFDPYPQRQAPRVTGDTYEAWLWKDPFGSDPAAESGGAFEAWDRAVKETKPDKKSEKAKKDLTCQASLEKIISDISAKKRSVKILAPLVKVTPGTVENKEMRTRQRYAVVAGLIESGYQPQQPGLLHFCSIQGNHEYDVRWEHYKYGPEDKTGPESEKPGGASKAKPDIVVAWIDSEILTDENKFPRHPCTHDCNFPFKNLLKAISKDNEFYLFDLNDNLGHDRSKQIKDHIKCINLQNNAKSTAMHGNDKQIKCNIELIKLAGMEGKKQQIKDSSDKNAPPPSSEPMGDEADCEKAAEKPAGELEQTNNKKTGSEKLADKLAVELTLRGVKNTSEVIIITEQGSENATELADNVQNSHGEYFAKIRKIFYLKGSDGNPKKTRTQEKKDKNEDQSADKPEHVSVIDLHRPPPLPVGPGQMDYFHRLAEEIRNVHDTVDFDKRDSGAKAVVILGSDFNDKLLIIEALREKMPHLLILTTDLDAQMLYPKHWRSTRNLVVASHFDLLLNEALQAQFPPFRDSQQTNIFYRTRSIVDGNASSISQSENTFPRIFEVGRNGFVRLGPPEDLGYHPPDNSRENTKNRLWLLLGIAVSLLGFHWAIRPWSGILSRYFFVGTFWVFAIAFGLGTDILWTNESGEPLNFSDGVSLWPTVLLQIIAMLWAGAFFVLTMCDLDKNFYRLSDQYFRGWLRPVSVYGVYDPGQDQCQLWTSIRPYTTWSSRVRSLRGWLTFGVLAVTIIAYAWNDVYPSELTLLACLVILVTIAIVYVVWFWEKVSIKHWAENDRRIDNRSGMWLRYFYLGRFGYRLARVIAMWLIFAVIETLLVYLLPPWPLPWRGDRDPASWIGVLSFVVTMLLLFFVLDAVRLNYYWIKKLRKHHSRMHAPWPRQACTNSLLESLEDMVEVVAKRTQAVDKLIYYPMLCIVLMLFAKITYFDNQDLPLSKALTFGVAISVLFFSGFMLRHEANKLRLSIRKDVQNRTVNASCTWDRKKDTLKRLDTIDEGAFQPMLEQPVMQALLIVLASISLFAGEYLKLFG
ncbi:MAG: hypothetical protein NTAFB09_08810 [Nitrosospira sp.]